jgi:two-component system response regulator YesN
MLDFKRKMNRLKERTFLIMDCNTHTSQSMANTMNKLGIECHIANNSTDALYMYESIHPDLVIVDFNIVYSSEIPMLKIIKKGCDIIPFIMLSGDDDKLMVETSFKGENHDFLIKPLNYLDLFEIITQINFK